MQVITTHIHADFDGLASMIAAQKLYPEAVMVFSGSQEKKLRDFTSQVLLYQYEFLKVKDIDLKKVTTLIIVDTRSSKRIGAFAACLDNPDTEIHIYDHHPKTPGDISGDLEIIKNVGATSTIFTELLQEKEIPLTPDEATVVALGIYEDTGSMIHLTTTPADLQAAAFLVSKGAKLDLINQFISHELTSQQVEQLHDLMTSLTQYTIQDIPVVIVTYTSQEYIDDFSLVVKRFMAMENLDTVFALISMAGKVYLIARSRIPEINVGAIARDIGGGGHATAASATVHDMTMIQAQDKLIQILHQHVRPQPIAKEMMSHPAITIPTNATLFNAQEMLTRYNITSIPVTHTETMEDGNIHETATGIITRQIIERAIHHDLGHLQVGEYMHSDVSILSLNATLADIQEIIIEHQQRIIPIVHDNEIKGIITRTDLLNRLVNDPANLPHDQLHEAEYPSLEKRRSLTTHMAESLNKDLITLLRVIGETAEQNSCVAFAVGGIVRDLLLKKQNLDLDVVIEGDGISFAKKLAQKLKSKVVVHERFSTAMVVMPDGFKIDVATARLEYYEYPAAMPTVELSSIKLDLYRRDFTINAMAIHLNPKHFGTLIDFFNCQNDLKHRSIKVLHNLSFVEDPTRIFRAIRLEQRMDFRIVKHTRRLIQSAVKLKLFGNQQHSRFFHELKIILSEENPIPAILRLAEFDLFQFLWPELKPHTKVDKRFTQIITQAHRGLSWFRLLYLDEKCEPWIVYILAIMARSGKEELEQFCNRSEISKKITASLLLHKEQADKLNRYFATTKDLPNSRKFHILKELGNESLLYLMAITKDEALKEVISQHITTFRQISPKLGGKELKEFGYSAGPLFREILSKLKDGYIDGTITTIEEEKDFLLRHYPLP